MSAPIKQPKAIKKEAFFDGSNSSFLQLNIFKAVFKKIIPREIGSKAWAGTLGNKVKRTGIIIAPPPIPKNELTNPTLKPVIINRIKSYIWYYNPMSEYKKHREFVHDISNQLSICDGAIKRLQTLKAQRI